MADGRASGAIWNVCVDFGTAFCKVAAARHDLSNDFNPADIRPLTIGAVVPGANPLLLESAVFIDGDKILFGQAATIRAAAFAASKRQALRSFKTILSAADLENALDTAAPASIDPHRRFRQRDLVTLFLAYLSRAMSCAIAADPVLAVAPMRMRYSLPAWRQGASHHDTIRSLFAGAAQLQKQLGDALFDPEGVDVAVATEALRGLNPAAMLDMGMIYEATAAAAYTSIGLKTGLRHLMVVDMGAGTTDFGALTQVGDALQEVVDARCTLLMAGDNIDRIVLDMAVQKAPGLKTPAAQAELWRAMTGEIRDIKENLFLDGKAAFSYKGQIITLSRGELERDAEFKALTKAIRKAFEQSLTALAARAAADKQKDIGVVAVGGGAEAPFIQDMLRSARAPKVRILPRAATPEWAHSSAFGGNLAAVFPQLAIAIGGALASEGLLAAR